jgi:predicted MFS family arabinose efflux permease
MDPSPAEPVPVPSGARPSLVARAPGARRPADGRVLFALCVASFLGTLSFVALAPFFPEMATDLETTVPLLGQVVTTVLLLSSILGLAVGPLADQYGHRRLMVVGMVAVAVAMLGVGLAPSYPVLLGTAPVGGLGGAAVLALPLAIAGTRFAGAAGRRAIGWTVASMASAAVVGVPLLTTIGGSVGWRAIFVGIGLAALGAAWLVAAALPIDRERTPAPLRPRALLAAYRPLLRHRPTLRLYAATALRTACWVGLLTYFGAFLAEELGLGTRQVGVAYMLGGAGYVLGSLAAGGWLGGAPLRPLASASTATMGLVVGLTIALPLGPVATVALLTVAAFVGAIGSVGLTTLLAQETPAGAAATMGLNGAIYGLGAAVGAPRP